MKIKQRAVDTARYTRKIPASAEGLCTELKREQESDLFLNLTSQSVQGETASALDEL